MRCAILVLLLLLLGPAVAQEHTWTAAEKAWMAAHPVIRVGYDPRRAPIEYRDGSGVYQGISSEYLRKVAQATGLQFDIVDEPSWQKALDDLRARRIDLLPAANPSSERFSFMRFSTAYLNIPYVIVTRRDAPYIDGPMDLAGKKVGSVTGYHSGDLLLDESWESDCMLVRYEDNAQALAKLTEGEVDAVVGNLVSLTYEMRIRDYPLRVAAPLDFDNVATMGVRSDWPELVSIIDQVLANIGNEERAAIKNQWTQANVVIGTPWRVVAWGVGGLLVLVLMVIAFSLWNHYLRREVETRKRIERAALESEHKFRMLFEHMRQGFALHEIVEDGSGKPVDFRYLEANSAFMRMIRKPHREIVGKTMRELLPMLEDSFILRFAHVAQSGEPWQGEVHLAGLDRWYQVAAFSPAARRFAVVFSDITEQKAEQSAILDRNAAMTHFLYTVSHDLRSPLLTIVNFMGELRLDLEQGEKGLVQEDLGFIDAACKRMMQMLDELRLVAQAGAPGLSPSLFTLEEIATEVWQSVAGRFMARHIAFRIQDGGHVVYGDRSRVAQLLQNLFDNAAKYMDDKPDPWVEVGVAKDVRGRPFYVRDNGPGIALENLSRVFGVFEKVDRGSEGSGIGLALVRRIVEAHGGRVWVESAGEGKGCCFYFTLELEAPPVGVL